jgi:hypothetical protein
MRFRRVPGGNHFLNDGPAEDLIAELEACLPHQRPVLASLGERLSDAADAARYLWADLFGPKKAVTA